jgi:hypothetical protein
MYRIGQIQRVRKLILLRTAYMDCRTHTLAERPSFVVDTMLMRIAPEVVELLEYPGYLYGILMFF